jgi:hypothetical protein
MELYAGNGRVGAKIVTADDVYLDTRAVFLIECLRQPGKTRRFYTGAVETALEHLEENSPGRCTRRGWIDMLFAAMERRVERGPHSGPDDLRDWWASEGRAVMRAHVERVRAGSNPARSRGLYRR